MARLVIARFGSCDADGGPYATTPIWSAKVFLFLSGYEAHSIDAYQTVTGADVFKIHLRTTMSSANWL
jgi:hypothetical protein